MEFSGRLQVQVGNLVEYFTEYIDVRHKYDSTTSSPQTLYYPSDPFSGQEVVHWRIQSVDQQRSFSESRNNVSQDTNEHNFQRDILPHGMQYHPTPTP